MALLTHSESLAFNGFLSSIDFGDALEWSGLSPDKLPLIPSQGKEAALAKATKDLMSLEATLRHDEPEYKQQQHQQPVDVVASSWPGLPEEALPRPNQEYTYGFGVPSSSRHPRRSTLPGEPRRPSPHDIFAQPPTSHPAPFFDTPGSSSSSFPPSADSQASGSRPSPFSATSAPAVLNRSRSGSKRSLADSEWSGAAAKRRRPSVLAEQPDAPAPDDGARPRSARASSVSSTTTVGGTPRDGEPGGAAKPALLSPSQKRANHIQSEQKRRANIRKGYEALCEVVPALRDAIRAEEERARADDDSRKRKKKAKSGEEPEKSDGRAGPKSENVVLQKTIDHLNALLDERMSLTARLNQARAALAPGHPALQYSRNHLDDKGTPLWEREWNGGTGWGDAEEDAGDDDS